MKRRGDRFGTARSPPLSASTIVGNGRQSSDCLLWQTYDLSLIALAMGDGRQKETRHHQLRDWPLVSRTKLNGFNLTQNSLELGRKEDQSSAYGHISQ